MWIHIDTLFLAKLSASFLASKQKAPQIKSLLMFNRKECEVAAGNFFLATVRA